MNAATTTAIGTSVNAASNTVPMQITGIPIVGLVGCSDADWWKGFVMSI